MIKNILVATDFSETARSGVDWAVELAKNWNARIDVVHVLLLPDRPPDYTTPPEFTTEVRQSALRLLEETTSRIRESGAEAESRLELGLPHHAIQEAARERESDLIVLGTRGATGLRHLLLGSTAERVLQHAPCPVLAVHPDDTGRHRPIEKILLPTDFSDASVHAMDRGLALLGSVKSSATILLLHAYSLPIEYTAYGTIPTSFDYLKDVKGEAERRLAEAAEKLRGTGWTVDSRAVEGYPPSVIDSQAREMEADLILVGTHGRSALGRLILGNTARRVVQEASCPVLVVPPRDEMED